MQVSRRVLSAGLIAAALAATGVAGDALAQANASRTPSAAGAAGFRPAAGVYRFVYDIDLVGSHIITLGVDLTVGPDNYDVAAKIQTVGMANWMFSWTQTIASQGALTASALVPKQHRMNSEFRGTVRNAAIDYADGKVTTVRVEPPPREQEVSERQRLETRDPVSAVIGLIYAANQGQRCGARAPVFDGRRRYDIVIDDMPPPSGSAVAAPAMAPGKKLACQIEFQGIAGELRKPRPDDATRAQRPNDKAKVWMEPIDSVGLVAPVRIEFDSWIGTMTLDLREAKYTMDAAGASAGAPKVKPPAPARR